MFPTWEVPPQSPFFAGHFAGNPILPGAALLQAMLRSSERLAQVSAVTLPRARFLQPVRPGAVLSSSTREFEDRVELTVEMRSTTPPATATVATATFNASNDDHDRATPLAVATQLVADTTPALPHQGIAVLLRRLLTADAHSLSALASVPATSPFAAAAWASAGWLEAAAQAAAAHGAWLATVNAASPTATPRAGMLVGLKNVRLRCAPHLDRECNIAVQRMGGSGPLTIYAARVTADDELLMRGELSVWTTATASG